MTPLPDRFQLQDFSITPPDVVRLFLNCAPEDIRERVIMTPIWYEDLYFHHAGPSREVVPGRVQEVEYRGVPITIIRSGMGAPRAGDAVLALGATPCRWLLFTGSVGGLDRSMEIGDLVLGEKTLCGDGFSRYLLHDATVRDRFLEPAYPDAALAQALASRAEVICSRDSIALHRGTVFATDSIVAQFPIVGALANEHECVGIEMESGATFNAASLVGIQAAALFIVSDVIPAHKSLFSGRTEADRDRRIAVRQHQLAEIIMDTLAAMPAG